MKNGRSVSDWSPRRAIVRGLLAGLVLAGLVLAACEEEKEDLTYCEEIAQKLSDACSMEPSLEQHCSDDAFVDCVDGCEIEEACDPLFICAANCALD